MGGQSSKGIDLRESFDRTYPQARSWGQSLGQANPPPPPPPSSQGYDSYDAGTYQSPYPAYSPPRAYPPPGYPAQQQPSHQPPADYPVQQQPSYQPPPKNAVRPHRGLDRCLTQIADNYSSLEQVTEALARAGLESSNLIVGIDFTKSNEWTGKHSFNGRSLHHIGDIQNPYEQAISIIGRTLSAFDEDNLIPSFGFGDASTHDQDVFSFYQDGRPCRGFPEALSRYREIVPDLRLAGPTSFAPIIEMAMTIVAQSGGQYHVLVIIADGQVTRSVDLEFGQLSTQEQKTVDAIVRASEFPLSIVLVGVGDGPWDTMKQFDDNIPVRSFDNFQFVNFTEIMSKNIPHNRKETEFVLAALMEIPPQYKATIELGILGRPVGKSPERVPLPPPIESYGAPSMDSKSFGSSSYQQSTPLYPTYDAPSMDSRSFGSSSYQQSTPLYPTYVAPSMDSKSFGSSSYPQSTPLYPTYVPPASSAASAPPASGDSWNGQVCPICLSNPKNMAFGCGHQTCTECGPGLKLCPICRSEIATRIKLY